MADEGVLKVSDSLSGRTRGELCNTLEAMIRELPPSLREDVFVNLHGESLKHNCIFDIVMSCQGGEAVVRTLIRDLALSFREVVVPAGDFIFFQDEIGQDLVCVNRGSLAVVVEGVELSIAGVSAVVGDNFFAGGGKDRYKRDCTVMAQT